MRLVSDRSAESWQAHIAYEGSYKTSSGKLTPWNMALAYEARHISDWRAFYCPSNRDRLHRMETSTSSAPDAAAPALFGSFLGTMGL